MLKNQSPYSRAQTYSGESRQAHGLTQPNVSDLLRGRLDGFTLDHLFRCLDALGQEVEIVVRPKQMRTKQVVAAP